MKRSWTLGQPSSPNRISAPFATGAESSNAACARTASGVCRSIRALKITKNHLQNGGKPSEDLRQHGSSVKHRQTSGCSEGCRCVIRHSDSSILDYFPGVTCVRPIRPLLVRVPTLQSKEQFGNNKNSLLWFCRTLCSLAFLLSACNSKSRWPVTEQDSRRCPRVFSFRYFRPSAGNASNFSEASDTDRCSISPFFRARLGVIRRDDEQA